MADSFTDLMYLLGMPFSGYHNLCCLVSDVDIAWYSWQTGAYPVENGIMYTVSIDIMNRKVYVMPESRELLDVVRYHDCLNIIVIVIVILVVG